MLVEDAEKLGFVKRIMKIWKRKLWQWETTGTETTAILFGIKIFKTDFRATGEIVDFKNREYNVYTVFIDGDEKTFAMTEVSNGVYDFLLFEY